MEKLTIEQVEQAWDWWKKLDESTQCNMSYLSFSKEPFDLSLQNLVTLYNYHNK